MKNIIILIIVFLSFNCEGQTYLQSDFLSCPIPEINSDAWYHLDTSKESFTVSASDGRLQITKNLTLPAKQYSLAAGKLLALDLGEWGGGLYYKPDDSSANYFFVNGKQVIADNRLEKYDWVLRESPVKNLIRGTHLLIAQGNTQDIVPYQSGWLFIQGSQIRKNPGCLSQLVIKTDSFIVSKIFDLDAAPAAIAVYKDKIFVATANGFYSVSDGKKELALNNLFWEGLYPNSIAVINEQNVYVGMRGGYAKIDLITKDVKFYKHEHVN